MNMHVWIIMGLTMVTVGGIVHVFIYPYLSGDINAEKRQAALRPMAAKRGADRQADAASRSSNNAANGRSYPWRRGSLRPGFPGAATNISARRSPRRYFSAG